MKKRFYGRYPDDISNEEMERLAQQELDCLNIQGGFIGGPGARAEQEGLLILLKVCHDIDVHKKTGRAYQGMRTFRENDFCRPN